jgi:hypothetical protein
MQKEVLQQIEYKLVKKNFENKYILPDKPLTPVEIFMRQEKKLDPNLSSH